MKNLEYLNVNVFQSTIVQTFDAPKLSKIVEQLDEDDEHEPLQVANSNFLTDDNVERVPCFCEDEEFGRDQILVSESQDETRVARDQTEKYVVDNRLNLAGIQRIMISAFHNGKNIFQVFGSNVRYIEDHAFDNAVSIRSAVFPNL